MIKKIIISIFAIILSVAIISACTNNKKKPKIGVSMGVGAATRWVNEKSYMEARAKELGVDIEVRLNKTDKPKTQVEDCIELIDSGIDVLILTPRDTNKMVEIIEYAKAKKVPVISYARVILGHKVDLIVGYDSNRIGQKIGQYLADMITKGDIIILRGDANDNNATLLHEGARRYIDPVSKEWNIILDTNIIGWSPDVAYQKVKDAVSKNDNRIDAILAPNDKIAGASYRALQELGVTKHVIITGMDSELPALKRIVAGTQDMTLYLDLQELASTAINEAVHMIKGEKLTINAEFNNNTGTPIKANLITGTVITKENIKKTIIDRGLFTEEEIYGK